MKFSISIVFFLFTLLSINSLYAASGENAGFDFEDETTVTPQKSDSIYNANSDVSADFEEGVVVGSEDVGAEPRLKRGIGWQPLEDRENIPFYLNVAVGVTIYVFLMMFTTGQLNIN